MKKVIVKAAIVAIDSQKKSLLVGARIRNRSKLTPNSRNPEA
jgi:hypothetical protein